MNYFSRIQRSTQLTILACLFLTLAIFVAYHEVAGHRFVEFDDGIYTFQNTYIIRGFCWDSICWAFTNQDAANWHPLTWISHLIDRELFGSSPGGYLLVNVLWHMIATCTCFVAFRKVTGSHITALVVATLFALHPANVENVAWTSERKSLLDAFFWFVAIIYYCRFKESRKFRDYGLVVIAHLLGLMSKAMSVTLPCTLILIELLHAQYEQPTIGVSLKTIRNTTVQALRDTLPLLVVSLYFCAVTASAQQIAMSSLDMLPLTSRLSNAIQSYERYIVMIFHPTQFAIFYPLFNSDITIADAFRPLGILIAITAGTIAAAKYRLDFLIGWLWFIGTMIPVIGLVQVGSQSHADRYVYIPIIGLALWVPALLSRLRSIRPDQQVRAGLAFSAITAVALSIATFFQVKVWENGVTLFQNSLAVTGDCMTSVGSLTSSYVRQGRAKEGLQFISSKIEVSKSPFNKAKLIGIKAQILLSEEKYSEALALANVSLAGGNTTSQMLWLAGQCSYELGDLKAAKSFLADAEAGKPTARETFLGEVGLRIVIARLKYALDHPEVRPSPPVLAQDNLRG